MFFDNAGVKLYYERTGSGAPLLLLHGWGGKAASFLPVTRDFSQARTVYAVDFPGHGNSPEPPAPWSVTEYMELIWAFIRRMDIAGCDIIAHSFGGRVIIKMLSRKSPPFLPQKVILVDSAGIKPKRKLKTRLRVCAYKVSKRILSMGVIKKLCPDALEKLRKKNGSADYNAASPLMRQCLIRVVNEDLTHLLPSIKVPTLLIWGENDTDTPLSDAHLMEKLIPDAGLVTLKNAGHYAFLEQQYTFNRVICSFLKIN